MMTRVAIVRAAATAGILTAAVTFAVVTRSAEPDVTTQATPAPLVLAAGARRETESRQAAAPNLITRSEFVSTPSLVHGRYAIARMRPAAIGDPTFGQQTISGIQGVGFEQDIRVDVSTNAATKGTIYTSVPGALTSDTSWIWRSIDGGKTFKWVPAAVPKTGKAVACAGGGDTELAVDDKGRLYFLDLTLANYSTSRSDDRGQTFLLCSNTGVPDKIVDRQWYAVDGDPVDIGAPHFGVPANMLYLVNNEFLQGNPVCPGAISPGNNQLVIYRSIPGPTAGIEFGPPNRVSGPCDESIMGNVEVSPKPTKTGEVGQPQLANEVRHVYIPHPNAARDRMMIARCFPVPFGPSVSNTSDPSGMRCNDLTVATHTGFESGANFPSLAIDKAGTL